MKHGDEREKLKKYGENPLVKTTTRTFPYIYTILP